MAYKVIKRILDIVLSLSLFIVISPFLVILAVIVEIKMGHPFYFVQNRTTKDERVFKLIKFRSMTNAKDKDGNLLPNDLRRTKFGNWLRSSSLDELPEIINIIKGDMSIIGPRPLVVQYKGYYKEEEMPRFKVRGGLIPPEVMHGFDPCWDDQLKWDAEYANDCSFKTDLKAFYCVFVTLFERNKEQTGSVSRKTLIEERPYMNKNNE